MDLIFFANDMYYLVPVTKSMLVNLEISRDIDCFDLCDIIRENFIFKDKFMGCICGAEAPQ